MRLYRCTRIPGTPRITEETCRKTKAGKREDCDGCPGVVVLAKRAGAAPEEFDERKVTPIGEVPASSEGRRIQLGYHQRSSPARYAQGVKEGRIEMTYDPEKHITIGELAGTLGKTK